MARRRSRRPSREGRRAVLTAAGAAVLLLAAGACGSSSGSSADPSPSASASSSAGAFGSPSGGASPTSSVAPATGPLLELEHITMNAPTGWKRLKALVKFQKGAGDDGSSALATTDMPAAPGPSLAQQAANSIKYGGYVKNPKYRGDVTIADVPWFHVAGMVDRYSWEESFGTIHNRSEVSISLTFTAKDYPPAERREIVESVLATVRWK